MCGICGVVALDGRLDPAVRGSIDAMTASLHHRGPDGQGVMSDATAAFGHRRLAIIDRATGHQPMTNEDGSCWVAFNGEIYNHHGLRERLEQRGHVFRTKSDTECIVHAYEEFGPDCVEHFEGMFAFAVYDTRRRELFIARDRLGKKPLFYATFGKTLHFGSEIKALRQSPLWNAEIDLAQLEAYLSLGYVLAPATMYRHVRKLPPGHWLRATRFGVEVRQYWDVERFDDYRGSDSELSNEIDETIRTAVRDRLESEVPLGAFLSGGIDSGLVVSYMAEALGPGVITTSVGFGAADDELDAAQLTATRFQTEHHAEVVRPDPAAVIDRIVDGFDEPFADGSAVPTFHVAGMAKRQATVVLSGDGGDEAFSGYSFRYAPHAVEAMARPLLPGRPGRAAAAWLGERWPRPEVDAAGAPLGHAAREHLARSRGGVLRRPVHGEAARRARDPRAAGPSRSRREPRLRGGHRAVPPLRLEQRRPARAVRGPEDLPRQRRPGEGRSHDHAARRRGAGAPAGSPGHRAGVQDSHRAQDAAAAGEVPAAAAGATAAAARAGVAAQARLPRADGGVAGRPVRAAVPRRRAGAECRRPGADRRHESAAALRGPRRRAG
jgi:asparagine synthase (glutamine-hydrolysing)